MAYSEIKPQEKLGLLKIVSKHLNDDITLLKDFKKFSNIMYDTFLSKNASPEKAISLVKLLPEAVTLYRLHSKENRKRFIENSISMDAIDDIDASFTSNEEVIKYLGRVNSGNIQNNTPTQSWLKIERFYVWKCDSLRRQIDLFNSHKAYDDGWFVYEQAKGVITKTNCLFLYEVEKLIDKTSSNTGKEKFRTEIIPAAPNNIEIYPVIFEMGYGESQQVNNLDFTGLDDKFVIIVKSTEDKDLGKGENLYIDIFYKKIITEIPDRFPDRGTSLLDELRKKADGEYQSEIPLIRNPRDYLADLRKKALAQCQTNFPNLHFDSTVIVYKTYDLNPACLRNFEELYEDFERDQDYFAYSSYLDSKYEV
jgi:hypothetical protein